MVSVEETNSQDDSECESREVHGNDTTQGEEQEEILMALKDLPPHFTLREAAKLPHSIRLALRKVLEDPHKYASDLAKWEDSHISSTFGASCCATISFIDEDLQLGSKLHNRPLFVSGYIQEKKKSIVSLLTEVLQLTSCQNSR